MKHIIQFIGIDEVIVLHSLLIKAFGGSHGLRDYGLLESALHQPMIHFGDNFLYPHIADMAGVYFFHILKNHPFVDGNKRTGSATSLVFLERNNHIAIYSYEQIYELAIKVASSEIGKDATIEIFHQIVRPV